MASNSDFAPLQWGEYTDRLRTLIEMDHEDHIATQNNRAKLSRLIHTIRVKVTGRSEQ